MTQNVETPGFGFTEVPDERHYSTLNRYALYVFDYRAPTGFRLPMAHLRTRHRDRFAKRQCL